MTKWTPSDVSIAGPWRAAGIVLLTALTVLGTLEIALRMTYEEHEANGNYWGLGAFDADPEVGYVHAAGYAGVAGRRRTFRFSVEISEEHLRQGNVERQRAYPRRVLVLGDSFPFGLGVAEESGFTSLMQKQLNAAGTGVINGAQSGYGTRQECIFGRRLAGEFDPELILLCIYPSNDPRGDYYGDYERIEVRYGYRLSTQRRLAVAPVDFLRTHSFLWMLVEVRIGYLMRKHELRAEEFADLARQNPERALESSRRALESLREFCEAEGIRLAAAVIPGVRADAPLEAGTRTMLTDLGIPFLDLAECGFVEDEYFVIDKHWNERGHARAAAHVGPFLAELLGAR